MILLWVAYNHSYINSTANLAHRRGVAWDYPGAAGGLIYRSCWLGSPEDRPVRASLFYATGLVALPRARVMRAKLSRHSNRAAAAECELRCVVFHQADHLGHCPRQHQALREPQQAQSANRYRGDFVRAKTEYPMARNPKRNTPAYCDETGGFLLELRSQYAVLLGHGR